MDCFISHRGMKPSNPDWATTCSRINLKLASIATHGGGKPLSAKARYICCQESVVAEASAQRSSATPNLLAISKSLPVTSVKGLIDYARANPDKLLYASTGSGASQHLTGEMFKLMASIQMTHIPFKAATLALTDVIAGRVHLMFENISSVGQYVKSGRLQGVAVTSSKRVASFQDLPTVAEAGVPGFESISWGGIVLPSGTPQAIVARLNREFNAAMALQHVKDKYVAFGVDLVGGTPDQFTAQIRKDTVKWADVVKRAGVKVD